MKPNDSTSFSAANDALLRKVGLSLIPALTAMAMTGQGSTDYGPAVWRPVCSGHWYTTGYGKKFFVEHDIEGYYWGCIYYFQNCNTQASVHYTINGKKDNASDANPGEVTQMVSDAYYAWHALCWNQHSMGTEHEGFASNPAWYTTELYDASALLTKSKCEKYGLMKDRNRIIGHDQERISGWPAWASANLGIDPWCNSHTDPGPYWDWTGYMNRINGAPPPPPPPPGCGSTSQYGANTGDVGIPDNNTWVASTINITAAPAGSTVTSIDCYFHCVHPYSGDLNVDLNADSTGALGNQVMWNREGGSADDPTRTINGITVFNGHSVNRLWYLYAKDGEALDAGYINEWSIRVYYNAPCVNNASVVSISYPGSVAPGQQFSATITMNNNGTKVWTVDSTAHNLGSQNPQDNTRWGTGRVGLPGGAAVNPGQNAAFTAIFTAPTTPGVYPFDWRMVEDGVQWFGATATGSITVANADVILDNAAGGFNASASWITASAATDKYGSNYRYRSTVAASDPATWDVSLGTTRTYNVYAWWSQGGNRSASAPYVVYHSAGSTTIQKNQQTGGGAWQLLGSWNMNAGSNRVMLSCWTTTGFIVLADAIKWQ